MNYKPTKDTTNYYNRLVNNKHPSCKHTPKRLREHKLSSGNEGTLDHLHVPCNVGCESLPSVRMASDGE